MECAHEPCTCRVASAADFCSESCGLGLPGSPFCGCEHAACEGSLVGEDPTLEVGLS
jgi:hypothetical protein